MVPSGFARQECMRSVGWLAIAVVGWSVIAVAGSPISQSAVVVVVLAFSTWTALTAGCVTLRLTTGRELFPWQADGLYLLAAVLTGFVVAYEVFVTGRPVTVFLWYGLATVGGAVLVSARTGRASRA